MGGYPTCNVRARECGCAAAAGSARADMGMRTWVMHVCESSLRCCAPSVQATTCPGICSDRRATVHMGGDAAGMQCMCGAAGMSVRACELPAFRCVASEGVWVVSAVACDGCQRLGLQAANVWICPPYIVGLVAKGVYVRSCELPACICMELWTCIRLARG
eukprot:7633250-Pyramimonas_sp.AAC.2